jgi:hypothetical protein
MHRKKRTLPGRFARGLVAAAAVVAASLAVALGVSAWSAADEQQSAEL